MKIQEVLNEIKLIADSVFGLKLVNQFILDLAHDGSLVGDLDKSSWEMIKLESAMSDCRNGLTYKNNPDLRGLPISRIETISDGRINFSKVGYSGLTEESHFNFLIREGNILFSHINSIEQLGKVAIYESGMNPLLHGMNLLRITPSKDYLPKFLFYMLRTSQVRSQVVKKAKQSINQASINMKELRSIDLPMPPMEHQLKIVNYLDALLSICGELEVAINDRNLVGVAFRKSAVDSISTAQTSEELQIAWERIQQNWEVIASTPESIGSLRNLILSIAISGNLTKDFHPEDSVEDLLSDVREIIDPYPEISDERFAVPSNWKWVSLASVAEHQLGKMLHTAKMKGLRTQYLRSVNVRPDGTIDLTDLNEMLIPESELEKYSVLKGDLFVNEGGDVGRNAIFDLEIEFDLAFQNQLHRLRPVCGIESRYLQFVLRQAKSQGVISQMSSGVTIQHFSASALRRFAIPLPPLSEQKLIVEKVNHLMKFCDELEREILEATHIAEKFAQSVVSA